MVAKGEKLDESRDDAAGNDLLNGRVALDGEQLAKVGGGLELFLGVCCANHVEPLRNLLEARLQREIVGARVGHGLDKGAASLALLLQLLLALLLANPQPVLVALATSVVRVDPLLKVLRKKKKKEF